MWSCADCRLDKFSFCQQKSVRIKEKDIISIGSFTDFQVLTFILSQGILRLCRHPDRDLYFILTFEL